MTCPVCDGIIPEMFRIFLLMLFAALCSGRASADTVISFIDPAGDDHGPGYYVYPANPIYLKGSFDITRFEVSSKGDSTEFSVRFNRRFGDVPNTSGPDGLPLAGGYRTGLVLQNIEVYIDEDHILGSGRPSALPGRRANMAYDSYWERAVLICPLPEVARKELNSEAPELSDFVLIPNDYSVSGDTVRFTVPNKWLGTPEASWGFTVLITPADLGEEKKSDRDLFEYVVGSEKHLLIRDVLDKPSKWNFGGGDVSKTSPNIIDMMVPSYEVGGVSYEPQEKVLKAYNAVTGTKVVLPAVYPLPELVTGEKRSSVKHYSLVSTILSKDGKYITIDKGSKDGIYTGRIGTIINEYGEDVTDVVVDEAHDTYSVCKIMKVSVLTYVSERMKVRFK
jgi:hypothetical protein